MSDPVAVALIAAGVTLFPTLIGIAQLSLARLAAKHLKKVAEAQQLTLDAQQHATSALVQLEKHTNGMKDELVKVTAASEFARGLLVGHDTAVGPQGPVGEQGPIGPQGKTGPAGRS